MSVEPVVFRGSQEGLVTVLNLPGVRPAVLCFMRISCSQIVADSKMLLLCGLYLLIFTVIVIKAEILKIRSTIINELT